jgi:hypothetical protein
VVEPKHRRPLTHQHSAATPAAPPTSSNAGCIWLAVAAIAVACFAIGKCSSPDTGKTASNASVPVNEAQQAIGNAIAAQQPAPVVPLSKASVSHGIAYLRLASGAEGLAGEMIYSQNCYDALSRHFSWAKLDVCGAFDADAAQSLGDSDATGYEKETAWFQSETAAGRYLKAATAAGEDADEADTRLSDLQAVVSRGQHGSTTAIPADNRIAAPAGNTQSGGLENVVNSL